MLRCRRCRKGVIDSTCLDTVQETIENSTAVCSIWHVNVDLLPEWILTSVHQAQWTVGKLNCQNCRARLGGFNFINRRECPCGRDATVHLNKSRVDEDQKYHVFIVQPRRTRPEKGRRATLLSDHPQNSEERPGLHSLQLNCAAGMSHISPAEASNAVTDSDSAFHFSPLYCISHRRRCSMEDDAAFMPSCFCPTALMNESAFNLSRAEAHEATATHVSFPTSQQSVTEASFSADARRLSGARSSDQVLLQNMEDVESSAAVREDVSSSDLFLREGHVSDSAAEQEQEVVPQSSPASNRLSKREKNRLKSARRTRRRRERWLQSQLEQEQAGSVRGSLLDSEEEDREGLTCAVCLDIYYSPHSCQPCGHIFCEPCLRTLARNRPSNTPCPLCRSLISHATYHRELNQTAETFFPKAYCARKKTFQNAPCAKWPLPSFHKHTFRTLWGYQRRGATARTRWHFAHAGLALHTLDFTNLRGWLFDVGLVIIYIHSVNWILVFLLLGFLLYYFFF